MWTDAAWNRCISSDNPARGDVSHRDLLSLRTHDVFEDAVTVEKRIAVMVADNDAVVADAHQFGVAVHHLPVVQRSKAAIAINEAVINSAAVPGIRVDADNHAVIVEGGRSGMGRTWEIGHGKKRAIAAALKDVLSIGVIIGTQKGVQVVYSYKGCAVVRGFGMHN